ncbi:hypothetical protein H9M94_00640 [Mycoplasma sp. Pen4]|uniref:hypothetical protein n=1 Tax=Mycoplasma sp. Pen4 TaxID=640330 RepID=UPI001654829E|nr:hypothetical protein [Mycoplasma sp. Pen4]QNM93771.1 hypothetical protein H9M94_00640 [Mycoplasma sp. Pen4]
MEQQCSKCGATFTRLMEKCEYCDAVTSYGMEKGTNQDPNEVIKEVQEETNQDNYEEVKEEGEYNNNLKTGFTTAKVALVLSFVVLIVGVAKLGLTLGGINLDTVQTMLSAILWPALAIYLILYIILIFRTAIKQMPGYVILIIGLFVPICNWIGLVKAIKHDY